MEKKIKVALVEDQPFLRESMAERLKRHPKLEVVLLAANGKDFLSNARALAEAAQPDVVLMDIEMNVMDGIMATQLCKEEFPNWQVIMFTVFDDDAKIFEAIQAGACGYLLKEEKFEQIAAAIECAYNGGSWMSPSIARKTLNYLQEHLHTSPTATKQEGAEKYLSAREVEVLSLLVQGMPLPKVAEQLFISYGTVRTHVRRIYEKLQIKNKVEATQLAIKNKWFT